MIDKKRIGGLPVPCASCPYRRDVPSGIWSAEEYAKLPAYDRPTGEQPNALFMCHQQNDSLCTGWLQSHANRPHQFDLFALRLALLVRNIDAEQVSQVCMTKPAVKLFRTGAAAMRHGMRALARPGRKAKRLMEAITRKRGSNPKETP